MLARRLRLLAVATLTCAAVSFALVTAYPDVVASAWLVDTHRPVLRPAPIAPDSDHGSAHTLAATTRGKFLELQRLIATAGGEDNAKRAVSQVLQSTTLRSLQERRVRAVRREAELETQFGRQHPELASLATEVAAIEQQLDAEVDRVLASYKRVFEAVEARPHPVIVTGTIEPRPFDRPGAMSSALLAEITFAGGALGFLLAFGAGLVLDRPDRRDAHQDVAEPHANIALLCAIVIDETSTLRQHRLLLAQPDGDFSAAICALSSVLDRCWTTSKQAQSPARTLDAGGRIMLLTSGMAHDGPSIIAANLALAYALGGARTLLVDGDVHGAALTQAFAASPASTGEWHGDGLVQDTTTGLNFLPASARHSPYAGQSAAALACRLNQLRAAFDVIIVNGPAVPASGAALALADFADQIVLMTSSGPNAEIPVRQALAALGPAASKCAGVVTCAGAGPQLTSIPDRAMPMRRA